jgi:hypothetical protein
VAAEGGASVVVVAVVSAMFVGFCLVVIALGVIESRRARKDTARWLAYRETGDPQYLDDDGPDHNPPA